jgi:hypothetical protein
MIDYEEMKNSFEFMMAPKNPQKHWSDSIESNKAKILCTNRFWIILAFFFEPSNSIILVVLEKNSQFF